MIPAACEQAGCDNWQYGWDNVIDERTETGAGLAAWIRRESGRDFISMKTAGGETVFRFEPFQRCFDEHRTRQPRFLAGGREHPRLGPWIGDLEDHLGNLHDQLQKG
jgi:hypothetical protein